MLFGTYRCYSVACLGRPELEDGDRLVLPSDAFQLAHTLKLRLPLLFQCINTCHDAPHQYCGVLEVLIQRNHTAHET
jgi:ubiquitin fusion degradation protein 1